MVKKDSGINTIEDLKNKKIALQNKYKKKIANLDKKITQKIAAVAKQNNYNIVLSESAVLCGGNDITENFIK